MEYYPYDLEEKLGHRFKDHNLLIQALTHSSCAHEMGDKSKCNERLEYLGDAILDFIAGEAIFRRFPEMQEGAMTELRASAVCERALADYSEELGLPQYIMLGKGEEHTRGAFRPSIMADAFEAILAAIYLDGGMEAANNFAMRFLTERLVEEKPVSVRDYKTALQEIVQRNKGELLTYELEREEGPPHDRTFTMAVYLNSNRIASGTGRTKKEAAQAAAREALALMGC